MGARVLVAMSGGVDSAVAAARLQDAGYDVIGVTLHLWDYPSEGSPNAHGRCCAPEDQYDARRTADQLAFPHYTFDRRALFARAVVAPFVEAYLSGETPSPCTACNRGVKLGELFALADKLGVAFVATGHYARVLREAPGSPPRIGRGLDPSKDQSYFLYATPSWQIDRLLFPLGESQKVDVRREATARGLPGAGKGESQELCFVGAGPAAYASFVEERGKDRLRPGPVLDDRGVQVGTHGGVHRFTVGQRKGLGVALGKPVFVSRIDASSGAVHLGDESALMARDAVLKDVHWADGVALPLRATARVRYRHEGEGARVEPLAGPSGRARLVFDHPVRAVTQGQVAVLYRGDSVVGGGTIASSSNAPVDEREAPAVPLPA